MTEREITASGGRSSPGERRDSTHSAPAQDVHSDDGSLEDNVRDKPLPVPSKRERVKRHFGRWKWWYLLALVILLAILLPLLFKVIIPAIIQNILNDQKLPIDGGALQALSPTHVNMSLLTSLDTPLAAKLDPVDLYLYNKETKPVSPFFTLRLPEMHINHNTEVRVTNQTILVANETELLIWFNQFFDQPKVELSIQGEPTVKLGTLKYRRSLDKTIEVPSLNYLNGFGLVNMEFMLKSDDTEFNMKGNLNIPNSGALTLGLGNLTFNLESGETRLGLVHLYDVQLRPGNNTVPFEGNFFFDVLVPNLAAILDSQKEALGNGYIALNATGNSTIINGEHIKFIEGVLNKKHIPFTVPVITLLSDVVGGILGADQGSLLDIFGGAIGNRTLFEKLLGHWEGDNQDGNKSTIRSILKNIFKLGLRTKRR